MNVTAILIMVFYFAIIIVPLAVVVRESLREISRMEPEIREKKETNKTGRA
jgi:hypothetical protein